MNNNNYTKYEGKKRNKLRMLFQYHISYFVIISSKYKNEQMRHI
jgi:hypothetical protein